MVYVSIRQYINHYEISRLDNYTFDKILNLIKPSFLDMTNNIIHINNNSDFLKIINFFEIYNIKYTFINIDLEN